MLNLERESAGSQHPYVCQIAQEAIEIVPGIGHLASPSAPILQVPASFHENLVMLSRMRSPPSSFPNDTQLPIGPDTPKTQLVGCKHIGPAEMGARLDLRIMGRNYMLAASIAVSHAPIVAVGVEEVPQGLAIRLQR